jgi:heparosan-N-sulfate-glucuronate 5-epimerase
MPNTFRVEPPWISAITQGEGASLFTKIHLATGDERFADAARRALAPMRLPVSEGGTLAEVNGLPYFEEYPTQPASLVLNGAIFALWGFYDVGQGLGDADAATWFRDGVSGLASIVDRYDTGHWSLYDLFPHPVPNVAGPFYHVLHINQLTVLNQLAPDDRLAATRDRFESYGESRWNALRALGRKVLFRLVVPRNHFLASTLPWSETSRWR